MCSTAIAALGCVTRVASLTVIAGIAGLGTSDNRVAWSGGHARLGCFAWLAFGLANGGSTSSLGGFTDRSTNNLCRSTVDGSRRTGDLDWLTFDSRCACDRGWRTGNGSRSTSRLAGSSGWSTGVACITVQRNDLVVIERLDALGHHTVLVAGGAEDLVLAGNTVLRDGDDIAATNEFRLDNYCCSRSRSSRLSSSRRLNGCRHGNCLDLCRNTDLRSYHDLGRRSDWR